VDADRPRLLHKVIGYTSNPFQALPCEPEAVSEEEQLRITRRVRRREEEQLRDAWRKAHDGIDGAIEGFRSSGRLPPPVVSDLRVIQRQVGRLDRRLGL
jgi:hypothetical protein